MKESVFTNNMSSGLICFKATILVVSYLIGIDMSFINELINRNIRSLIKDQDFLQRAEIIAFNFFTYMVNENKFFLFTDNENMDNKVIGQDSATNTRGSTRKNSNEESKEMFVERRNVYNSESTNFTCKNKTIMMY